MDTLEIRTTSDYILAAVEQMDTHGWTTGKRIDDDGSLCTLGALTQVFRSSPEFESLNKKMASNAFYLHDFAPRMTEIAFEAGFITEEEATELFRLSTLWGDAIAEIANTILVQMGVSWCKESVSGRAAEGKLKSENLIWRWNDTRKFKWVPTTKSKLLQRLLNILQLPDTKIVAGTYEEDIKPLLISSARCAQPTTIERSINTELLYDQRV